MTLALERTVAPAVEPITVAEAKAHLRIDGTDEDGLLDDLIRAVRQQLEGPDGELGRVFITQTWRLKLDAFPAVIVVPLPPLQSVSSIVYLDAAGTSQTLSTTGYTVDTVSQPGRIVPAYGLAWPSTQAIINAVTVTFVAGYGDKPVSIPQGLRLAMATLVGHFYAHREPVTDTSLTSVPDHLWRLVAPYRLWSLAG